MAGPTKDFAAVHYLGTSLCILKVFLGVACLEFLLVLVLGGG